MYIDTHAHLFPPFFEDIDILINNLKTSQVKKIINIGTNLEESKEVLKINQKHKNFLYTAVGIHPDVCEDISLDKLKNDIKEFKDLVKDNRDTIIAIGECGLDYKRLNQKSNEEIVNIKEQQEYLFKEQIELSIAYNLPLIIHCREAMKELTKILLSYNTKLKGVLHSADGDISDIKELEKLGFFLSFNGISTFKNAHNVNTLLENTNIDKLIIETDSPFLSPHPIRGTKNTPLNIEIIYKYIADKKQIPLKTLCEAIDENVNTIFGI